MASYDHGGGCPCGLYKECDEGCEHAPKKAATNDGWKNHKGGGCPKAAIGKRVEVRFRSGTTKETVGDAGSGLWNQYGSADWRIQTPYDIVAYRIIAAEPAAISEPEPNPRANWFKGEMPASAGESVRSRATDAVAEIAALPAERQAAIYAGAAEIVGDAKVTAAFKMLRDAFHKTRLTEKVSVDAGALAIVLETEARRAANDNNYVSRMDKYRTAVSSLTTGGRAA